MMWLYPDRCFSMSFQSWVFCAERELRSFTAASRAECVGLDDPLWAAMRPSTERSWLLETAGFPAALMGSCEGWGCGELENEAAERTVAGEEVADGGKSGR